MDRSTSAIAVAAPSSAAVGGMVVVAGLPSTTTDTVEVCPSTVSVEVQTAPAGMAAIQFRSTARQAGCGLGW